MYAIIHTGFKQMQALLQVQEALKNEKCYRGVFLAQQLHQQQKIPKDKGTRIQENTFVRREPGKL